MAEDISELGSIAAIGSTDSTASYDSRSVPQAASTQQPSVQPLVAQAIDAAVKQVNERLSAVNRVLEFNVDMASGLTVATIRNSENGEVLQQFPGTDALQLAQMLADWAGGKNALLDLIA